MIKHKTILFEAIHTYAGEHLPYIPHEVGFQWIVSMLYQAAGWKGLHILTVISIGLLLWGLYRLVWISQKELQIEQEQPLMLLLLPILVFYIYSIFFTLRPQMISAGLIVWFVVWMREFQMEPSWRKGLKLGGISFLLANLHAGVWPVIAVFYGMNLFESLYQWKKLSKYHVGTMVLILLGGLLNPGGWKTIFYIITVKSSGLETWISEWQPILFSSSWNIFAAVVLFILCFYYSMGKGAFRFFLAIGVFYLGISNYKQHLFLLLILPYYLPAVPFLRGNQLKLHIPPSTYRWVVVIGLVINLTMGWIKPYEEPKKDFPVEEMNVILKDFGEGRPKVMANYGVSGYVMFRGGDTLSDGRFDPFVTEASKGLHQWTAFERSANGFQSRVLLDIVQSDKPDYLIIPHKKHQTKEDERWSVVDEEMKHVKERLGSPLFSGSYGEVWRVSNQ